ncbi:MAG TPA: sugar ABC transporter ATP-binding protein [Desulfocapsa sulfexigens]|nr:sugar ABC transporter ATP-binding protein [Desulfocapsa sulfexigens]
MDVLFQHISKKFGSVKALTDVSFTAHSGSIHGLIGENGAGKSTLMKILTGYQSRSSGTILIDSHEVTLDNPRHASKYGIGMLYQEPMDFISLTVLDNFSLGSPKQSQQELRFALESLTIRFGFHLDPNRLVESLTVGERQQIELLRLIHCKTRVLILDEPTTGISPAQKEALFPALKQLAADGMTILLVSHKLEEVATLCDEVTVLRHGRITHHATAPFHFPDLLTAMFGSIPERKDKEAVRKKGSPVLLMQNIEAAGERHGLQNCDISIAEGEVIGLAGLDGAGQSTFLRLAAGLTLPEHGTIQLFGKKLPRSTKAVKLAHKLKTFFIPADRLEEALFANVSLSDHFSLREKQSPFWHSQKRARSQAKKAISTFSIIAQPDDHAEDLSGGNQQRLLLALLDSLSRLVLLENPTRGLDIRSGHRVWQYLKNELSPKTTIIFSSPELDELLHYSDRVLVFHDGEIVLDSAVTDTSHDSVAAAMTGLDEALQ